MRAASTLRLKLRSLFARRRLEQELDEELRYHVERQVEEGIAAGMTPENARYAALRSIKDIEQRKEECRDMRGIGWLEDFVGDLQYASRQLLKNKSFFAIAAVTLALGIGANTAIFSAVNTVLLRPFPYRQADRLVDLWCTVAAKGIPKMGCALPDLREIATRNHSFEAVANYYSGDINITGGTPERVQGVYASAGLFPLLGVNAAVGRTFSPSDEVFGKNHVVLLSGTLWRERFGGNPEAIGDTVRLNGEVYTVIGVMPADFQFPNPDMKLWLPMSFGPKDDMATRDNHFISSIARLRPGATIAQSRADVQATGRQLEREFGQNAGVGADASDYLSSVVGDVRRVLLILLGAVGVVLLIACVNVANLLLSRASGRQRELSVRAALGASRGRLVRQLISESILLGGIGAALGLALSAWLVRLIRTFGPADIPRLHSLEMEPPVLVFAAVVTLASVVLFGLAPAMSLARVQVSESLKDGGRSLTAGSRTSRSRDLLVIAELTLSLVLVISAGLLLQTLRRLQRVDPGLKPENVLTMSVTLPPTKYSESQPAKSVRFFDEVTSRIEQIPGVRFAGASTAMPISGWGGWGKFFTVDEHPATRLADVPLIQYQQVMPQFAKALGIPITEGRFFTDDDTGDRPLVAVINESARKRFFPNVNPIGKRVYPNPPESTIAKSLPSPDYRSARLTIIGVIGDVRQSGLSRPSQPGLFVPYLQGTAKDNQTPSNKMFLFVKTDSDPLRFANAARRIIQSLDSEQPVADVSTMEQRLRVSLATQRFQFVLFGSFAAIALLLAAVGIYGVLSYSVRLRLQEIGIRMALGAGASDGLKMVVKLGLALGLAGVLIGRVLAWGVTRLMASLLFGIQANDAMTFVGASLVLLAVVAVASLVPSVRAARTDAVVVLRAN
jgi:predicted permease